MKTRQEEWQLLDRYRRQFFLKYEVKAMVWRAYLKNNSLPLQTQWGVRLKKTLLPSIATVTTHRNRCVRSGRQYNVLRKVQYSRFVMRRAAYSGTLPGVSRFSR